MASLAGLESALEAEDAFLIELAIGRILLLHNMILAFGGIPLLYMGDEIGLLNDNAYLNDDNLAGDNRWMHRPPMDWNLAEQRSDEKSVSGRIFQGLVHLIRTRKRIPALHAEAPAYAVWTYNEQVFGLLWESPRGRLLVLGNFSKTAQAISPHRLMEMGFDGPLVNQIDGRSLAIWPELRLEPYEAMWLEKVE